MRPQRARQPLKAVLVQGYDRVSGEAVWTRRTALTSRSQNRWRQYAQLPTVAVDINDTGACP